MSDYLDTYKQIAEGHPDDSYEPGTSKQRIDLTEFYKETQQDDATIMVTGAESLRLGKFSKQVAAHFKLTGYESYDPFPSERNARAGQEGFFTVIKEGFKTFVENIIKYIRMAVDWVVDTVKSIFGFRKSARINKAVNDELGNVKQEFVKTLNGLGFPGKEYNLENFLMELPPDQDRVAQVMLLKSKFDTDQGAIDGLYEALPLLQQGMAKLAQATEKATRAKAQLSTVIDKEYRHSRVRAVNPNLQTSLGQSPEVNRLVKSIQEVGLALDTEELASMVSKLYETLYKIKFSNEELQTGFSGCRKKIQDSLVTERAKLRELDIPATLQSIQNANLRYIEITANTVDISKINFKVLGTAIDKTEADKIREVANQYSFPPLLEVYEAMAYDVRNFTQFCTSVSQSLLVVDRQVANLVDWYNRASAYYYHGLLGEVEALAKLNTDARKKGHSGNGDVEGYPYDRDQVFIKDADAKTLGERMAATNKIIIEEDLAGVKTALNNFSKQAGWSKMV